MQTFSVDISTSHIPQALYVKQGDSLSRFFALTIADNGSPWEPPENAVYTIRFSTSAGSGWYDTIQLVGGTTRPAVSAAGNVLTCEVAEQATLGNGQLCVMVNDATGYQLGMWNLNIIAEVVPGADSQEAESYYGVLAGQIAQALAAEQVATEQANLAKQYADSIDPSQFATQAQLAAKTTGHVIHDPDGTAMPQRANLKFAGAFSAVDDPSGDATIVSTTSSGTQNVAGYVGEISLFADNQLRENHVWADGSTIDPAQWPDLAAYAATAGWKTDSSTGWYKTPNLQGSFLLPSSSEHAVNTTGGEATHTLTVDEMPAHTHELSVGYRTLYMSADEGQSRKSGDLITESGSGAKSYTTASTGGDQPHNNMPPYYVVTAQIRAKVDIIEATAVEVNSNTLSGFDDGQALAQQGGKIVGKEITAASLGAVQPYQAGDTITLNHSAVVAYVTGGGADLNFQIPLDKPVNATAAAFSGQINVRMSTGQYALNNITVQSTDSAIGPSGVKFTFKPSWDNTPTNNIVLVVQVYAGATITLS
mgnify:CR=1 FL=1